MKEQPNDELLHISRKALKDYRYLGIADLNAFSSLGIAVMEIKSNICANRFYDYIEERKLQCQNIWTKDLTSTLVVTLD